MRHRWPAAPGTRRAARERRRHARFYRRPSIQELLRATVLAGELGRLDGLTVMMSSYATDHPARREPRGPWERRSNRGPRRADGRAWCRIPELPPHAPGTWRTPQPLKPWSGPQHPLHWYPSLNLRDTAPRLLTSYPPTL